MMPQCGAIHLVPHPAPEPAGSGTYTRSSRVSRGISALPTGRAVLPSCGICGVSYAPDDCRRRGSAVGGWPDINPHSVPGGKGGGGVVLLPPRPYYTIQAFYIANIEHNMLDFIFSLPGFLAFSSTFLGIRACSHAGRTLGRRIAASGSRQSDGCQCT